ncbi:MAG: phosphopantetheine--protein transferase domain protein [Verrucomicrobiales bacterium]|nr:phosphopantetheine--protein transferase domain protein [Verrucomicrobiales bacterium]
MILGTGIDIVEVDRIRRSLESYGDRFIQRILRPDEIAYCLSHSNPAPFVAARFAAKEAVSKAFGTGIGKELRWKNIEVIRKPTGSPDIVLHDEGAQLLQARGARTVHLSISHTQTHCVAMAILES